MAFLILERFLIKLEESTFKFLRKINYALIKDK